MQLLTRTERCSNQQALSGNIQKVLQDHFDHCIAFSSRYFKRDLLDEALLAYCEGHLTQHPQLLALSEALSCVFLPWMCLRWSYQGQHTISSLCSTYDSTHSLILSQAQSTPFSFYQVLGYSPSQKHVKVKQLLTGRIYYLNAAHLDSQHGCNLSEGEIIFAMIDVGLFFPVVYSIAPIKLHSDSYNVELKALHKELRQSCCYGSRKFGDKGRFLNALF